MAIVREAVKNDPELLKEFIKTLDTETDKFEQLILQLHELYFDRQRVAIEDFAAKHGLEVSASGTEKISSYIKTNHIAKIKNELAARRTEERDTLVKMLEEDKLKF